MAERTIARVLGFGSAFIAVVVVTGTVTDPVNVTKLFALGGGGGCGFCCGAGIWIRAVVAELKSIGNRCGGLSAGRPQRDSEQLCPFGAEYLWRIRT